MPPVGAFPFLAEDEFVQACEQLQVVSDYRFSSGVIPALTLSRTVSLPGTGPIVEGSGAAHEVEYAERYIDDDEEEEAEQHEEDEYDIVVLKPGMKARATSQVQQAFCIVTYDIVLSPSYRVPVVYLQPRTITGERRISICQLHDSIVPSVQRSAITSTGVYGSLSMTDHPVTGLPAYFIHPCRTADSLRVSSAKGPVSPIDYLLLWFGLIGTSVGLTVPIKAALHFRDKLSKVECPAEDA